MNSPSTSSPPTGSGGWNWSIAARRVRVLLAHLPRHIAERECRTIAEQPGWEDATFTIDEVRDLRGPGNAVMIELEAEHVPEVFTAFGWPGVRAEDVAKEALRQAEEYLVAGVPVGRYLADQLVLPLRIGAWLGSGGGVLRTTDLSPHATTHLEILRRFLELDLDERFQAAFERTRLPEQPDYAQVDALLIRARRRMVGA
jgi:RNA 3'-terminal phosphate cyclase (ATP)